MTRMAAVRRAGGRFLLREVVKAGGDHGGFLGGGGGVVSRALLAAPAPEMDAPETAGREPPPAPAGVTSAMAARMTPAVLFVTVVLAVVLLVSGMLHVLRRLFLKSHHGGAGGAERQLQQLFFPPHEDGGGGSGLGQDAIDTLPEFAYGELSGAAAYAGRAAAKGKAPKEDRPFDCAVCLCEFADDDRLRLLPHCGHAFHVACIDVWLRSSATCPLCRTTLRGLAAAAVAVASASDTSSVEATDIEEQKQQEDAASEAAASSVVLPVRLGRFKNVAGEASTSTSPRLDGRRCFSMGSHQYVLADEHLLVSVHLRHINAVRTSADSVTSGRSSDDQRGKKKFGRGDSFSVSKIWQWRGGDRRLPSGLRATAADDGLPPWAPPSPPTSGSTRQQSDT